MAENAKKLSLFGRIAKFFKDQKGEMKKIAWPTKKQTIGNTKVVLLFVFLAAIVICGFDWLLGILINFLVNL